jgi:hypothetical protein
MHVYLATGAGFVRDAGVGVAYDGRCVVGAGFLDGSDVFFVLNWQTRQWLPLG